MSSIETVVLRAVKDKYNTKGDSFRMKHEFKMDGSVCTDASKDPALVITRDTEGWVWHCHRCNESGYIGDRYVNPDSTVNKIKQLFKENKESSPEKTLVPKLPDDCTPLVPSNRADVPFEALHWLWKYSISDAAIEKFGFVWSAKYEMVILPLFSSDVRVLNGWIGRRITTDSKEKGKYYIHKPKGSKDRLYFTIDEKTDQCILVEDCVSAIKVNSVTKITTTALLTTSIDENLTRKLRGKEVYIWLDADALAKSVAMVARFRQLGIIAKHIYTSKDPKCYNGVAIKDIWNDVIATGNKSYSPGKEV